MVSFMFVTVSSVLSIILDDVNVQKKSIDFGALVTKVPRQNW